jgi:hypothetical protein
VSVDDDVEGFPTPRFITCFFLGLIGIYSTSRRSIPMVALDLRLELELEGVRRADELPEARLNVFGPRVVVVFAE